MRSTRWLYVLSAVLLAAAGVAHAAEGVPVPARLIRWPYLQRGSARSIVVCWRTIGPTEPVVRYGLRPDRLDGVVRGDAIRVNDAPSGGPLGGIVPDGAMHYEATLAGLQPRTAYFYAVLDGDRLLAGGPTCRFRTYPEAGSSAPIRFAAYGDSHGESWNVSRVNRMLLGLAQKEGRPVDLFVHCGDFTSKGRDLEYRYLFNRDALLSRQLVIWPTIGNHDMLVSAHPATAGLPSRRKDARDEGPYFDYFVVPTKGELGGAPSNTELYYSFDVGRVHFVCLASFSVNRRRDAPMAAWLRRDLAKAKADGRSDWIVAWCHSPMVSGVGSDSAIDATEMREHILPLLEKGGVDLLLGGHYHIYERTMLIDGATMTPLRAENAVLDDGDGDPAGDGPYRKSAGLQPNQGTVALTCGIASALVGHPGYHPVAKRFIGDPGAVVVDIEGDTLTGRLVNIDGKVRDTFQIVKRGAVAPKRIARPKPGVDLAYRKRLPGLRSANAPRVKAAGITLDGKLDEPVWKQALRLPLYRLRPGYVLCDDEALYLGVYAWTGRQMVREAAEERDQSMQFDYPVELLVDADYDRATYYAFAFNWKGTRRDAKAGDFAYNPDWQVATVAGIGVKNECWSGEARIPWQALGLDGPPPPGARMGMNAFFSMPRGHPDVWFGGRGRYVFVVRPTEFGTVTFRPGRAMTLIPPNEAWRYHVGAPEGAAWAAPDYDDATWREGKAGLGYGGVDNATQHPEMKGRTSMLCIRRAFDVEDPATVTDLGLMMTYDDAFIAYLNGREVLRVGVAQGAGATATGIAVHEGTDPPHDYAGELRTVRRGVMGIPVPGRPLTPEHFPLTKHLGLLRKGRNVLAIEGHNATLDSKAFTLDPHLVGVATEKGGPQ